MIHTVHLIQHTYITHSKQLARESQITLTKIQKKQTSASVCGQLLHTTVISAKQPMTATASQALAAAIHFEDTGFEERRKYHAGIKLPGCQTDL